MKISKVKYQEKNAHLIKELVAWESDYDAEVEKTVAAIIHQVRELGDVALLDYTRQFDRNDAESIADLCVSQERLVEAWESATQEQREALQLAKQRITAYAEKQKLSSWKMTDADGSVLGQQITALDSAGLYVPGGRRRIRLRY